MTRENRRRLAVVGIAATIGAASPLWGPRVLRTIPSFRVSAVEVVGARFVGPDAARALAAIPSDASVWDDHRAAAERLRTHPLVEEARIRRDGLRRLQIELDEVRPVVLVPTPVLRAVDGRGEVLPLEPAAYGLDLPILQGAVVGADRVSDEDSRRVLEALERLLVLNTDFAGQVSEVRPLPGDAFELVLLVGSHAERLYLPVDHTDIAFLRIEEAVRQCSERGRVISADARFRDRVVVRLEEST